MEQEPRIGPEALEKKENLGGLEKDIADAIRSEDLHGIQEFLETVVEKKLVDSKRFITSQNDDVTWKSLQTFLKQIKNVGSGTLQYGLPDSSTYLEIYYDKKSNEVRTSVRVYDGGRNETTQKWEEIK